MKIFMTVNLALQYSLILNDLGVKNRLLSFVHFQEAGSARLDYYAEHGHFKPSDRSKYKGGLPTTETTSEEPTNDNRQPRRPALLDDARAASARHSILHPRVDPHPVRRRIRDDVQ